MIAHTVTGVNAAYLRTPDMHIHIPGFAVSVFSLLFCQEAFPAYAVLLLCGKARTFCFFHKLYQMCCEVPS